LISLGRLFHLSQTRTLKKFFLMSNLAAGIMTFKGSAACLVMTSFMKNLYRDPERMA
jgi:hypothetical protein